MRPMFFSFDGIDGGGKSTQIEKFRAWLALRGIESLVCRDPGGTELGERIRSILLEPTTQPMDMRAEMLLYMASRAQLVSEVISPAILEGKVVISDRYIPATVAYQGYGGGLAPEDIKVTGQIAVGNLVPDMTFILDLDYPTSQSRLQGSADRIEARGQEYFDKVREGFLEQARQEPDRMLVINANLSVDQIHHKICDVAKSIMTQSRSSVPGRDRR
ncbi:MAG: dTMP kinase [Pirellulaceae bacterium]|nr:dTMP kinase [Pirellulaceae bacterium]